MINFLFGDQDVLHVFSSKWTDIPGPSQIVPVDPPAKDTQVWDGPGKDRLDVKALSRGCVVAE